MEAHTPHDFGCGGGRINRGVALRFDDNPLWRNSAIDQVSASDGSFGELRIAARSANRHDQRSKPLRVKRERVVKPRLQDRRRTSAVLSRTHHDDNVGRLDRFIVRGLARDAQSQGADISKHEHQRQHDKQPQGAFQGFRETDVNIVEEMPVELITSAANPLLKEIRKAQESGGLMARGWLIAEGPRLVDEAMRSGLHIACALASDEMAFPEGLIADRLIQVPERVYESISGTTTPQGLMALAEPPEHTLDSIYRGRWLVVILENVQDPGNAGTIARSAEAFGASGLIFLGGTVNPMNPKTLRSSAGSLFRVPFVRQPGKLTLGPGGPVFAGVSDPSATLASDCDLAQPCSIVIGNEGSGVSANTLHNSQGIRIPTVGVESLNAAVAASVLLYEAARQRRLK
jgi:TrmH family RNA methyltransferase